jgi:hypothetical protein
MFKFSGKNSYLSNSLLFGIWFFGFNFQSVFAQDPKDKYYVIPEVKGMPGYTGMSGQVIVVQDCDVRFRWPGCGEERIGFYNAYYPEPARKPYRMRIVHSDSVCGPGFVVDYRGGIQRTSVTDAGIVANLDALEGKFYEVYPRSTRLSGEEAARIGGMRFQFKFKPGACSGKPPQQQKSVKSAAPPPRDEIRVPYRDPPSSKKAGPKIPFKEPPPSMPRFRPFESFDEESGIAN